MGYKLYFPLNRCMFVIGNSYTRCTIWFALWSNTGWCFNCNDLKNISSLALLPPHSAGVKFHMKSDLELLPFSLNTMSPVWLQFLFQINVLTFGYRHKVASDFFLPENLSVEDVFGASSEIWGRGLGRLASRLLRHSGHQDSGHHGKILSLFIIWSTWTYL